MQPVLTGPVSTPPLCVLATCPTRCCPRPPGSTSSQRPRRKKCCNMPRRQAAKVWKMQHRYESCLMDTSHASLGPSFCAKRCAQLFLPPALKLGHACMHAGPEPLTAGHQGGGSPPLHEHPAPHGDTEPCGLLWAHGSNYAVPLDWERHASTGRPRAVLRTRKGTLLSKEPCMPTNAWLVTFGCSVFNCTVLGTCFVHCCERRKYRKIGAGNGKA